MQVEVEYQSLSLPYPQQQIQIEAFHGRPIASTLQKWVGWGHYNSDTHYCKNVAFSTHRGEVPLLFACASIFICFL